jgi:hypothetical protein
MRDQERNYPWRCGSGGPGLIREQVEERIRETVEHEALPVRNPR